MQPLHRRAFSTFGISLTAGIVATAAVFAVLCWRAAHPPLPAVVAAPAPLVGVDYDHPDPAWLGAAHDAGVLRLAARLVESGYGLRGQPEALTPDPAILATITDGNRILTPNGDTARSASWRLARMRDLGDTPTSWLTVDSPHIHAVDGEYERLTPWSDLRDAWQLATVSVEPDVWHIASALIDWTEAGYDCAAIGRGRAPLELPPAVTVLYLHDDRAGRRHHGDDVWEMGLRVLAGRYRLELHAKVWSSRVIRPGYHAVLSWSYLGDGQAAAARSASAAPASAPPP